MHDSARVALERYRSDAAALRYEGVHRGRSRHRREDGCIRAALSALPQDAAVLDLPCGTGRMFATLAALGARVTGADGSPEMVERARTTASQFPAVREVRVEDIFATSFADQSFDAVVCNRLLHHFADPADRRVALRELARVSRRWVVVSFFCSHSLDALRTKLKRWRGKSASARAAIAWSVFRSDVESSGLRVVRVIPTLPGISQQWYVVAER